MSKMTKIKFRIGVLAKKLQVERFVVRFWEQEFGLKTNRSLGKQRYYQEEDLKIFTLIKDLLYARGYTITGAKKELLQQLNLVKQSNKPNNTAPIESKTLVAGAFITSDNSSQKLKIENEQLWQQITTLQSHLKKLQKLL